jgi:hypothetical protein
MATCADLPALPDEIIGGVCRLGGGERAGLRLRHDELPGQRPGRRRVAVGDLVELDETVRARYRPDPSRTYVVDSRRRWWRHSRWSANRDLCRRDRRLRPISDFAFQTDYFGDFRVVFDYFFPGVLPGSPLEPPAELQQNWDSGYVPAVTAALFDDEVATGELALGHRRAGRSR